MILINSSPKDALKIFQHFLPIYVPIGVDYLLSNLTQEGIYAKFTNEQVLMEKRKAYIEADGNLYPCPLLSDPDKFKPLNWKDVGIKKTFEHGQQTNICMTCPIMAQNDHYLLLGLKPKQIFRVIVDQLRETLSRN